MSVSSTRNAYLHILSKAVLIKSESFVETKPLVAGILPTAIQYHKMRKQELRRNNALVFEVFRRPCFEGFVEAKPPLAIFYIERITLENGRRCSEIGLLTMLLELNTLCSNPASKNKYRFI